MLRRSSPASGANAGSAGIAERMAEAAAAVRGDCAAAAKWWRIAAPGGDACSAEQRREAERQASLPLGLEEAAP